MECAKELIHGAAAKSVSLVQLSLPFRLWAALVESRVDGIRRSGLHAVIGKYVQKYLVFRTHDLIDAERQQPFAGEVTGDGLELQRARSPGRQSKGAAAPVG